MQNFTPFKDSLLGCDPGPGGLNILWWVGPTGILLVLLSP